MDLTIDNDEQYDVEIVSIDVGDDGAKLVVVDTGTSIKFRSHVRETFWKVVRDMTDKKLVCSCNAFDAFECRARADRFVCSCGCHWASAVEYPAPT